VGSSRAVRGAEEAESLARLRLKRPQLHRAALGGNCAAGCCGVCVGGLRSEAFIAWEYSPGSRMCGNLTQS